MNNPDQEYVDEYINDMKLIKNQLLERRRTLQQKVEQEEKARENKVKKEDAKFKPMFIKCTMCGVNFNGKSELYIHVRASHGGTAIY